mmetsp:Transcript_20729/g.60286  ORF Transcript_20729/g.60286 Transcript_20729/m.60286 type:complete len:254 (-) Transcript_20729:860-1621(-)
MRRVPSPRRDGTRPGASSRMRASWCAGRPRSRTIRRTWRCSNNDDDGAGRRKSGQEQEEEELPPRRRRRLRRIRSPGDGLTATTITAMTLGRPTRRGRGTADDIAPLPPTEEEGTDPRIRNRTASATTWDFGTDEDDVGGGMGNFGIFDVKAVMSSFSCRMRKFSRYDGNAVVDGNSDGRGWGATNAPSGAPKKEKRRRASSDSSRSASEEGRTTGARTSSRCRGRTKCRNTGRASWFISASITSSIAWWCTK